MQTDPDLANVRRIEIDWEDRADQNLSEDVIQDAIDQMKLVFGEGEEKGDADESIRT